MNRYEEALQILEERFGHDTLLSVATLEDNRPSVRNVDSFYEDGAFYIVTYALSNKMKQIAQSPEVAVCGEWFTAHGLAENMGYVRDARNADMMSKLRTVFAEWYDNGHVDEEDPNTCLLRIRLTDGVLMYHGTRYAVDFANRTA